MTEKRKIIDTIDTNQNGIIDRNEYQNFKNVIKDPKSKKELVEAIDNNKEILLLLKPAIEDMVNDIGLLGKQDEESMFILEFYETNFDDEKENLEINGEIFEVMGDIILGTKEETQFFNELQENLDSNPQVRKAKLIEDIAIVFIQYMEDICNDINFPDIRLLDNRIREYIEKTKELVIDLKLNNINPEKLTDSYLMETISNIFDVSEIHGFGIENMEILISGFKENLTDMIGMGIIDTQETKLNFYKQIRTIDKSDSTGRHNSSNSIVSRLSDDILINPDLNEIEEIQKRFEAIQTIFQDERESSRFVDGLVTAYFDKTENWTETMGEFYSYTTDETKHYLIEHGMDIKGIYDDIYNYMETNLHPHILKQKYNQLQEDILEKAKDEGKDLSDKELEKETTKQYILYINLVKETLRKNLKTLGVKRTLKAFPEKVEELKKKDELIGLYTDIEGIGSWDISDRKIDLGKEIIEELVIQLILMYLSGGAGNMSIKILPQLQKLKQLQNIKNIEGITSSWITAGALDGATFHLTYNTLFNLKEGKNLGDGLMNGKNWAKDILFIAALRGLNSVKIGKAGAEKTVLDKIEDTFTVKGEKLQFSDKVWNIIGVRGISIGAETAILYGLGTGVNIVFGEGITNDPDEIIHIITMVLGLRMVNKTHGSIDVMANKINGKLQIKMLKKVEKQEIKDIHKMKIEKQSRSGDRKPPNTGYESIAGLAGFIPLSELFRLGSQMEEYEEIRDGMIKKGLTKQGADNLSKDNDFISNREKFIEKVLSLPSVKLRIEDNNWDIDKVREGIRKDFEDMLYLLGGVEQVKDKMEGNSDTEKKKNAIKELFGNNEDERLAEILITMVDDYYSKSKKDTPQRFKN